MEPTKNPNTNEAASAEKETAAQPTAGDETAKRIQDLEAQVKDKEAKYLYLYAEFENFKKRAIKERSDLIKFGWESLARELLQVIDNLERALAHMPASTDKTLIDGLHMVLNQFRATMQQGGVHAIEAVEKPFDPNFHEAVAQAESEHPEGTIVQEHAKGYTLHGRLLRPARVVVSTGRKNTGQA